MAAVVSHAPLQQEGPALKPASRLWPFFVKFVCSFCACVALIQIFRTVHRQ